MLAGATEEFGDIGTARLWLPGAGNLVLGTRMFQSRYILVHLVSVPVGEREENTAITTFKIVRPVL